MQKTQTNHLKQKKNYQQYDIPKLLDKVGDDLPKILDKYELKYHEKGNFYVGCCPVHMGDNPTAFNIYKKGRVTCGNWKCWTHFCHETGQSLFDLVVHLEEVINNKKITKGQAIKFVADLYNFTESGDYQPSDDDKRAFSNQFGQNLAAIERPKISREIVRSHLKIPSPYFIRRGFHRDILDKLDVGDCITPGKEMYCRAVAPIYDMNGHFIGCTGRSIHEQCTLCKYYHADGECRPYPKWKNTEFDKSSVLYNLPHALESIKEKEFAFIVESPGNVWRLLESGFTNSLALLGCDISENQIEQLLMVGVYSLVLLLDKDENMAGEKGQQRIVEKTKKLFKISTPEFVENDIGCMSIGRVKQLLGGFVNG